MAELYKDKLSITIVFDDGFNLDIIDNETGSRTKTSIKELIIMDDLIDENGRYLGKGRFLLEQDN